MASKVPVCRPKLPSAGALLPYLETIDQNRFYSNHGPLSRMLETRMARRFGVEPEKCLATGTGSSALFALLRAVQLQAIQSKKLCLTSAFGFSASAAAIKLSGLTPYFVDIDPQTWQITPDALRKHPRLDEAAVVMPVAPFGRRIDLDAWASFERETGVPVVVDAAACFDTLTPEAMIALDGLSGIGLSLHATKSLPAGEGGLAFSRSKNLIRSALASINHGFQGRRDSICDSMNGKISEYHSAVALASLDAFSNNSKNWQRVQDAYQTLAVSNDFCLWEFPDVSCVYALAEFPSEADCLRAQEALSQSGIQTLQWYGRGLHRQSVYADLKHDPLNITDTLSGRLLGLPMYIDMTDAEVCAVINGIRRGLTV